MSAAPPANTPAAALAGTPAPIAGAASGEPITVVLGEGKLSTPAGTKPVLITQTLPEEESASAAAQQQPVRRSEAEVAPLSAKGTQAVIEPAVKEVDKLVPPAKVLDAPLDTTRPEEGATAASSDAASSSAASSSSSSFATAAAPPQPPHALSCWDSITARLKGKEVVVFLDYDGTLTPIVSVPSEARIAQPQRERLAALANKFPVSIVTGRTVGTIKQFLLGENGATALPGLDKLYFAGSHGFDISCPAHAPSGSKQVAAEYLPMLRAFHAECARQCAGIEGSICEDNTFSISIHYRNVVDQKDVARIDAIVDQALRPFEGKLQRHYGKMVHEIRPNIEWHKGAAVDYLLHLIYPSLPSHDTNANVTGPLVLPNGRELSPVYIGDDTTDEDAFKVLRRYNGKEEDSPVLTVFVRTDDKARATDANYVVRDPEEVGQLLGLLAKL